MQHMLFTLNQRRLAANMIRVELYIRIYAYTVNAPL
jgi:hypothetical protein